MRVTQQFRSFSVSKLFGPVFFAWVIPSVISMDPGSVGSPRQGPLSLRCLVAGLECEDRHQPPGGIPIGILLSSAFADLCDMFTRQNGFD